MALLRFCAAVTTLLTSGTSRDQLFRRRGRGQRLIEAETVETDDFSALVSVGKSCFAELTTAFASLCTF